MDGAIVGDPILGECGLLHRHVRASVLATRRVDDLHDGQIVGKGERVVALVVRRHGHHRAGAVRRDDVVGDPDGDDFSGERISHVGPQRNARLGLRFGAIEIALSPRGVDVGIYRGGLWVRHEFQDERMLGRENDVRNPGQRVGAGREDTNSLGRLRPHDVEIDLRAFTAADPMVLLAFRVRPIEVCEVRVQTIGIRRNLEHPLAKGHSLDRVASPLALSVDHLFVGEHGAERRAPVDGNLRLVGQAALEELEKDPLRPFDVSRVRRIDLAGPVVTEAEALQLSLERRDVLGRRVAGVRMGRDRVLFCRETERVPAHGMQHVQAAHAGIAGHDIRGGVTLRVADVEARSRGIREHVEDIELLSAAVTFGKERSLIVPVILPLGLNLAGIVAVGRLIVHGRLRFSTSVGDPDRGAVKAGLPSHEALAGRSNSSRSAA